ncbi:MAG TPA: tRNA methyltransferase, partial [Thermoprotei archaeon]|nr:tRNA methyltransferase [Thermoprotei archaeon]
MIKEGDYALFFDERGKKRLIKIRREGRFQSDLGYIEYKDVIGRYYGERFETSKNRFIWVLKPSLYDFIMKIKRRTQIVYPKDIGYIIVKLGVKHNSKILEIGTGSGALTTAFAWILSKEGLIDTFD